MTASWYWLAFVAAVVIVVFVPIAHWLENRADERDRKTWEEMWR